jgi:hypothetical protein
VCSIYLVVAWSAEASVVIPVLHQCEDVQMEGVVARRDPGEHVLELLVLFVQAPDLRFGQRQLIIMFSQ